QISQSVTYCTCITTSILYNPELISTRAKCTDATVEAELANSSVRFLIRRVQLAYKNGRLC
ncbi:hypothetical protein M514_15585, partial [Trichuris suis]